MSKDLRKEQVNLLRLEKKIAGVAAVLATGVATAASAKEKLGDDAPALAYAEIQAALVNLAEVTAKAHDTLQSGAIESGLRFMEVSGGRPKVSIAENVQSLLGL